MGRAPSRDENGLKKGPWTQEEDEKLVDYIQKHGCGNWRTLPNNAGLQRCGKSCRLRWTNYLRPDIKRGKFSVEEEDTIIHLHSFLGNKWSLIAARLPGRTDNEIKNLWNTHIRKRLLRMGIDPLTHTTPILNSSSSTMNLSSPAFNYNHATDLLRSATSDLLPSNRRHNQDTCYLPLHGQPQIMSCDYDQIHPLPVPPPLIQTPQPDHYQEIATRYCNFSCFHAYANEYDHDRQLVQDLAGFICNSAHEEEEAIPVPSGTFGYYSVMDPTTSSSEYTSIFKSKKSSNIGLGGQPIFPDASAATLSNST